MRIEDFKAGKYLNQNQYKSFQPEKINHEWMIGSAELIYLLSEAHRPTGELNAFSEIIPDVDYFIKMHIAKEANTLNCSKIVRNLTRNRNTIIHPL